MLNKIGLLVVFNLLMCTQGKASEFGSDETAVTEVVDIDGPEVYASINYHDAEQITLEDKHLKVVEFIYMSAKGVFNLVRSTLEAPVITCKGPQLNFENCWFVDNQEGATIKLVGNMKTIEIEFKGILQVSGVIDFVRDNIKEVFVGDYRIIFDVDNDQIVILQVQHRRDIYKNL